MIHLPFPAPAFRIKKKGEASFIFDAVRKRWILLTEEEWVRQNMVAYLTGVLHYPKEYIALEKAITVNGMKMRFDLVVYDKQHQPWMLVECKAPGVPLGEAVLQQALRYHLAVPVTFILLTNGMATIAWEKVADRLQMLDKLPPWIS